MNVRKMLVGAGTAALVLTAAACHDDEDSAAGPATVTKIAASEIGGRTDESSAPLEINDLPIDDRDTDEASSPLAVN